MFSAESKNEVWIVKLSARSGAHSQITSDWEWLAISIWKSHAALLAELSFHMKIMSVSCVCLRTLMLNILLPILSRPFKFLFFRYILCVDFFFHFILNLSIFTLYLIIIISKWVHFAYELYIQCFRHVLAVAFVPFISPNTLQIKRFIDGE